MDADFGMAEKMDIIFCRNVVIYFDKPTQQTCDAEVSPPIAPGRLPVSWTFRAPELGWM
jgi:chemotaxis protein methyltransferase CheR